MINGKAQDTKLKTISLKNTELIGKTIALRSPQTCAADHGKHVCKTCYGGALSEINKDLNTGLVAVLLLTNILTQRLLSAKHLLVTNTDKVEWGEDFMKTFIINMDSIYFNDIQKIELTIQPPTEEDYDEDMDAYKVRELTIKLEDEKKSIHYVSPEDLFIDETMIPKHKSEEPIKISSDSYGTEKHILKYIPHNNTLSKSLQNILDLIESTGHLGVTDYNDLVNTFGDLLIENNMDSINLVHAEMICSKLVVDDTTGKRLDWSKPVIDKYKINRVSKTILSSPLATSLAFERLPDQFSNIETYFKDEESIYDTLFQ